MLSERRDGRTLPEHPSAASPSRQAVLEELSTEVRVDGREVRDPVVDMRSVVVGVEGPVMRLVVAVVISPPVPVRPVRSDVLLRPEDLVHRPEDAVALPPGTGGLAGVAGQSEALVVVIVVVVVMRVVVRSVRSLPANLGVLPQLGQPDELLVQPGVFLDLMSAAGDLHFDSVFLLLFKEIMFALLVVASKRRRMPGSGAHLAAHRRVWSAAR